VLGYVLWFQAKHGRGGSAGLTAATVRSCLGNHYIRTHARPDLTWIHYGLQAAAAYGAFLRARAWAPPEVVAGLLALPRDAGWFRLRLAEYWRLEGDGFRSWVLERDYTAL
jgi:hypothetical protein